MKIRYLMTVAVLAALTSVARAEAVVGEAAPSFSVADCCGKKVSLDDFKGKYVVLEWTNHECPFVVKHYSGGNMQALQKEYTGKGVVWLSVISSAPGKQGYVKDMEQAMKLTEDRKASPSHVLFDNDGTVGKAYGAKTTPHMFIINPEGKVIYAGAIDDKKSADAKDIATSKNYVKAALDEALAGKPVTAATSAPYGCSVKY
jgi:peroxiredoxin